MERQCVAEKGSGPFASGMRLASCFKAPTRPATSGCTSAAGECEPLPGTTQSGQESHNSLLFAVSGRPKRCAWAGPMAADRWNIWNVASRLPSEGQAILSGESRRAFCVPFRRSGSHKVAAQFTKTRGSVTKLKGCSRKSRATQEDNVQQVSRSLQVLSNLLEIQ